MRKFLFATAAFAVIAVASPAAAADLPRAMPPIQPVYQPAGYNWTGFYFGPSAGYNWGRATAADSLGIGSDRYSTGGWLVGGQTGFNWQMGGSPLVLGIEADAFLSSIRGSVPVSTGAFAPFGYTSTIDRTGSVRGRIGYAFDRSLIYGTGGWAWAHTNATLDAAIGPAGVSLQSGRTQSGWTAGAGWEQAITRAWSARLEYRYTDFGRDNYDFITGVGAPTVGIDQHMHTVLAGFNYRFWPGQ